MIEGNDPGGCVVGQDDVIGPDGPDLTTIELAVGGRDDAHGPAVLCLEQVIAQASPAAGGSLGSMLLSVERLVEAVPQPTRQVGEIGMLQRVDQCASSGTTPMYQAVAAG